VQAALALATLQEAAQQGGGHGQGVCLGRTSHGWGIPTSPWGHYFLLPHYAVAASFEHPRVALSTHTTEAYNASEHRGGGD